MKPSNDEHKADQQRLRRAYANLEITLIKLRRDLDVLGSEFSPYLHEEDAQLNESRQQVQHDSLDNERNDNGAPAEKPGAPSDQA